MLGANLDYICFSFLIGMIRQNTYRIRDIPERETLETF